MMSTVDLEPKWLRMTVMITMTIHHAQQVQILCVVWKPRVEQEPSCAQQTSPFFMFGSASQTKRDIISYASLTRALRSTSQDIAWTIRVLTLFIVVT